MRLIIHFARYGPYHHARLRAAHEVLSPQGWEVIGLETAGQDATYAWDESKGAGGGPRVVTAFPGRVHEEIRAAEYRQVLRPLLDSLRPDAMAIAGWGSGDARTCLDWCRRNQVRPIVMSETRAADGRRVWWKERIKRFLISRFDAALVGGESHRDYLVNLGMKPEHIAFGYNVVDNEYFEEECLKVRKSEGLKVGEEQLRERNQVSGAKEEDDKAPDVSEITDHGSPITAHSPYFLASNRFVERKNLSRLVEAYASYVRRGQGPEVRGQETGVSEETEGDCAQTSQIENHQSSIVNPSPLWNLCLLGDGELKADLITQCKGLGLEVIAAAPWESSVITGSCLPPPLSSSLTTDPCPLAPDSSASHSHLAPLGTSGLAQRSGPTDPCPLPPDSSASHSHLAPMGTSGLAQRSGPTDPWPLPPDSSASHSHLAPMGTSGLAQRSGPTDPWPLTTDPCPLTPGTVYFPGFRQIEELPRFYAAAACFIHPALEEPWGLVLNEAMACGLPILASRNGGAAEELVVDGVNGWGFDAADVADMASALERVAALADDELRQFGAASERILEERCPTAAFGRGLRELLDLPAVVG
jgi:glycosyltransferase involved in cell wall biosynthesis